MEADRVCRGVLHFVPRAGKVGYGEIAPVGTAEQAWCIFCILLGISNLAYIQFSLFLLAKSDPKTSNYRDFSEILGMYCNLNSLQDIEPSMQQQLKLQYLAAEMSDDVVLQGFPLAVKQKVLGAIYLEFIRRCSLFSGIEQGFLEEFLSRCSVDLFMPGVDLVQKGFVPTHLLILLNGTASTDMDASVSDSISVSDLRLEQETDLQSSKEIHAGQIITEVGFLTRTPQSFQVCARTLCKVLTIPRDSFDELINFHPDAMKVLLENVLRGLKQNIEQLQRGSGPGNTNGASSIRNAGSEFWLPKHRRALDAVRMSINRFGSLQVSEFLDLAFTGDLSGVEAAIAAGMDINCSNYDGRTALMIASSRGFRQVVHALLRAGAEVNTVDSRSHSALLEATLFGHDKIIKLLLEYGAEIRAPSEKQASLLCTATGEGNLALVKRLLQAGVDPNAEDYGQRTALHVAISVGNLPAVDVLFLHGAKLKKDSRWKDTHLAYSQLMERKVTSYFKAITEERY